MDRSDQIKIILELLLSYAAETSMGKHVYPLVENTFKSISTDDLIMLLGFLQHAPTIVSKLPRPQIPVNNKLPERVEFVGSSNYYYKEQMREYLAQWGYHLSEKYLTCLPIAVFEALANYLTRSK